MQCVNGFFLKLGGKVEYPFIKARIIINGEEKGEVYLLVDTGAGITSISYKDSLRLNLTNLARKKPKRKVIGVSGVASERVLRGDNVELVLYDSEGNRVKLKLDEISVADEPPRRGPDYNLALQRPSVLGWNVLKEFKVEIDFKSKIIRLCVK